MPALEFKSDVDGLVKPNLFGADNALTILTHFRLCVENHVYQLKNKFVNIRIAVTLEDGRHAVYNGCIECNVDRELMHLLWFQSDCNFIISQELICRIKAWVLTHNSVTLVSVDIDDIV